MQEAAAKKKQPHQLSMDEIAYEDEEEEGEYAGSLTAQLAETAVSVREMSKQLGTFASPWGFRLSRCSVRSLIVANRTRTGSFYHPTCPNRHKGSR